MGWIDNSKFDLTNLTPLFTEGEAADICSGVGDVPTDALLDVVGGLRPQNRAQLVSDDDVEQGTEVAHALLLGDVADPAVAVLLVPRRVGGTDHVVAPIGEAPEHTGLR